MRALHPIPSKDSVIIPSPSRGSAQAAWSQFGWLVLIVAAWSGILLTLPLDPDYTAGELLDHLMGWMETGRLYPAPGQTPTARVLNYPPLVLGAARGLTAAGLSPLSAGRMVNALGTLALLAAVAGWARARGASGPVLAGTVGLLAASFPFVYGTGQFHIESWAAAGTLAGFGLLERGRSRWAPWLAGTALAMACFAKHTEVVPALVALGWAWRYRRSDAPQAAAAWVILGAAGAAWITAAWGMEAWRHLLTYTVGTFSPSNLLLQFTSYGLPWAGFMAFAVATLVREGEAARRDALVWYGAAASLWSLAAVRDGASYPYFLGMHLALALWVGPRMFGGRDRGRLWRWLLAIQLVGANVGTAAALSVNVVQGKRLVAGLEELCAPVLGTPGPILTEEAGVARACGRPARVHPFIISSLSDRGLWDILPFVAAMERGELGTALLPFDPRGPEAERLGARWAPPLLDAFRTAPRIEPAPMGHWWVRW